MSELMDFAASYTAAWCSQEPARVAAFFAEGGWLAINGGAPAVGRPAITDVAASFMSAFPDLTVVCDRLELEPLRYHWTLTGTHAATGRFVRISGYEEWRMGSGGLIGESRGHFDQGDYDRQLGVS